MVLFTILVRCNEKSIFPTAIKCLKRGELGNLKEKWDWLGEIFLQLLILYFKGIVNIYTWVQIVEERIYTINIQYMKKWVKYVEMWYTYTVTGRSIHRAWATTTHRALIVRYPQTCLKLGCRVTQTYVVAIFFYQSTHAIYHIKSNFRSDDVLHDVVD